MSETIQFVDDRIRAEEAMRIVGERTLQALYRRVRLGQVPAARLGRSLRFSRKQLEQLFEPRAAA